MKINTKFRSVLAAAAFAGLAFASQVTYAAQINALFVPGQNTIEDTSAERILRGGVAVTDGAYQVGDVIESILRFTTVNSQTIGDFLPAPYQLTAYSQLRIDSIDDLGGGFVRLNFGPTGVLGVDVLAKLFERTSALQPSFSTAVAPAVGVANVLAQTFITDFGFEEADDFWFATATNDIGDIATATPGSGQAPSGNFGLSQLANPGGFGPVDDNAMFSNANGGSFHDAVGDASVFARNTGVNTGWLASDNVNLTFTLVPEPGSLALLALGLLGLGFGVRKRNA